MGTQTIRYADIGAGDNSPIEISGLDPTVAKLGLAVGLLQPGEGVDTYLLNTAWFADPLGATQLSLTTNGPQLADLIAALLGSLGGTALGIPLENTRNLGTWYPILNPSTGQPTGLYLVSQTTGALSIFSLGINYNWPLGDTFAIRAWGLLPILQVGNASYELIIGQDSAPLTVGIETASSTPLINAYGLQLAGMRLTGSLALLPDASASISLEAVGLQLPGESEPKDRSLSDLEQLTGTQILATVSTIFVAAMSDALGTPDNPQLGYVLPVLGMSPVLPQAVQTLFPDAVMPLLRWDEMITAAINGGNPAQPFKNWFSALLSTPDVMGAWLASIQGLEGLTPSAATGSGTRENPWNIAILSNSVGALSFQFATLVNKDGSRTFYPGLAFRSSKVQLGTSQAALQMAADLELAQFNLSLGGVSGDPTNLAFASTMMLVGFGETSGVNNPLFSGSIAGQQYTFGSLVAGLRIGYANGQLNVVPSFTLTGLDTPAGTFLALDLLQPMKVLQETQTVVAGLINSALQQMFGITADSAGTPSYALAALLGVVPPGVGTGNTWPANLDPPLSATQLFNSVQNPVQAMATYYYNIVNSTATIGSQAPFFYMLREMATLLQALTQVATPSVTGTGSPLDPWKASLTDPGTLVADVIAYTAPQPNGADRLVLGIDLGLQLVPTAGLNVNLILSLELLALDLSLANGAVSCAPQILPGLGLSLSLPDGYTSPAVCGTSISVSASSAQMGWSPYSGWSWSMEVGQPALISGGHSYPVGQNMVYTQGQSLEDLVLQQAATFGQILVGVLGLATMQANDRAGLAFAGILGLLPNLGPLMPEGLTWPGSMPTLTVTSFNDPFQILRTQLVGIFSTPANLQAALQLLAWASSNSATVPAIPGSGTLEDPFHVPLGLPANIGMAIWSDGTAGTAGIGLDNYGVLNVSSSVQCTSSIVVRLLNVTLSTGAPVVVAGVPGLSVTCKMANPGGQLLPPTADGTSLDWLVVGAAVGISGTFSAPQVTVTPTFLLFNLTLPGQSAVPVANLADPGSLTPQLVQDAFRLGLQVVLPTAVTMEPFRTAYNLLATMGLALPNEAGQQLGINPAGWRGLLADPLSFCKDRLIALAADPATQSSFLTILQQLTGVTLPTIPASVLDFLAAMGLTRSKEAGYVVIPSNYVALFSHPVVYVQTAFAALLADEVRLAALLASLQQSSGVITFSKFQLQVFSGPVVQITLPPGSVSAGTMLEVSGVLRVALNAGAQSFSLAMTLYNPQIGIGFAPTLTGNFSGDFAITQFITFGDGTQPAPAPLKIWPFNSTEFVNAFATVAPFYALSIMISQVIDPQLLQKYTLVQALFAILGIAEQDQDGTWHTKALLGLFEDPLGWLLSDAVLGADGKLNIPQLNKLLLQVPNVTGTKPTIQQIANGIQLGALPYNLQIALTADKATNQVVISPSITGTIPVAGGAASVTGLVFNLSLGPDFQPGFGGTVTMAIKSPSLSVTTGYDKAFLLSVTLSGDPPAVLQLVPFTGWQQLLSTLASYAAAQIVPQLTTQLLQALSENGAAAFATAMQTAGTNLNVSALLSALVASGGTLDDLETAALNWLGQRLTATNMTQTAQAVVALLQLALGNSVTSSGGLVSYIPSQSLPLSLQAGAQGNTLGVWASITMPSNLAVQLSVAPTGLALPYDPATGAITGGPEFSFGLGIGIPIKGETNMPLLSMGFANQKFTAGFDPMGTPSTQSDLYVELLPQFFSNPQNLEQEVEAWLLDVFTQVVPRYLSLVMLNQSTVKGWLDSSLFSTTTPGTVLVASGLLVKNENLYLLQTFAALSSLTVSAFLANLLKALLSVQVKILDFGAKGQVWIGPNEAGSSNYGIMIAAQNLSLDVAPNFVFQLGASDSAWITAAGGPTGLHAGLNVFVPIDENGIYFEKLLLQLVNIGVDFVGRNKAPLIDLSRFTVRAIQPRGLLLFDFAKGGTPNVWGGEVTIADIGISLSPQSIGSGGNPVAQNLLGSGSSDGGAGTEGNAANPPFSFQAGYVSNNGTGKSVVELLQGGQVAQELWFPVQSGFGPIHVNLLGVKWISPQTAGVGFDGNLNLAGLGVAVKKLTVSFNVFAPTDYTQYQLDLAGLDVTFNNGPVAIAGGFLKQTNPLQYTGTATLSCASFTFNAIGSYAVVPVNASLPGCQQAGGDCPTAASLFIFVNLNAPLGGPPAFFITGLAAGFGYNRNILIPAVGDISTFPFVMGATDPSYFTSDDPATVLTQISNIVPPEIGAYWVAAGIKFTSFELLNTFALLFVKFGKGFELDLVGVTSAALPPRSPLTLAYMELGILISFRPDEGYIAVQAQLTPNSYLLAPPCRLTGGFAFILWFSGDFVLTLGGYNPLFSKPPQYPEVPRLGFTWPVSVSAGELKIAGGAYFALTPTAIMAGGYLQVAFTLGPIRAWLNAGADFLIQWKPFYYDISVEVSIGVAFHTEILGISITISASLGAALHIWGPETAGYAEINWYVISFTIPIGDQNKNLQTQPLGTWDDFANAFLPPADTSVHSGIESEDPQPPGAVLTLSASAGALSGPAGNGANGQPNAWALTMANWQIQVSTAVPATSLQLNGVAQASGKPMGVRPMNLSSATTPLSVTLSSWNAPTSTWIPLTLSETTLTLGILSNDAPMALWGQGALNLDSPPTAPFSIAGACVGLTVSGVDFTYSNPIGPIPLQQAFAFAPATPRSFPNQPQWTAPPANTQSGALQRLSETVMAPAVIDMRNQVLAALEGMGMNVLKNPQLPVIAAYADALFQAPPYLAPVGVDSAPAPATIGSAPQLAAATKSQTVTPQTPASIQLIGGIYRNSWPGNQAVRKVRSRGGEEGMRLQMPVARQTGRWIGPLRSGVPNSNLSLLRAQMPQTGNASEPVGERLSVAPGAALLVETSLPAGAKAIASVSGNIPVRVWALNAYDELVGANLVEPGNNVTLPSDISHAVMSGESRRTVQSDKTVGWQLSSTLTQVGRYSFIGDACLVRPQATPARMQDRRHTCHGSVDGACILRNNTVHIGGRNVPGWVETMLAGAMIGPSGSVAVCLRNITAEAAGKTNISLAWTAEPWQPTYEFSFAPQQVLSATDGCILVFNVPAGTVEAWLAVLVPGSIEYQLEGVWGISAPPGQVARLWPGLTGLVDGIPPTLDQTEWSTVSVNIPQQSVSQQPDSSAPVSGVKGVTK
ncbi:DUF6603 domain-containing protein [Silvibacterium acidisoli]|uniref:DUF6603 domain-containing protein n=1 Tax=Acidobacteriaceae bacterium ZG23-2 TaxID=2883246 RepID=UPI00406C18E9